MVFAYCLMCDKLLAFDCYGAFGVCSVCLESLNLGEHQGG